MVARESTRREFVKAVGAGAAFLSWNARAAAKRSQAAEFPDGFLIGEDELTLRFVHPAPERRLSFRNFTGPPEDWRRACRAKLAELLHVKPPAAHAVRTLRTIEHAGVTIDALVMEIDDALSIPAYRLTPAAGPVHAVGVMAIHGHGEVEPCLGVHDDYHRRFALRLAQAGRCVLAPELRGFGTLRDVALHDERYCLDYWDGKRGRQFTLVTDGFLHGRTLIGQTTEDLLAWENWWAGRGMQSLDVVGISYGGDLCLTYPAFSRRVRRVFCSGSFGSFAAIFSRCYNAPAHCIPGVLAWMDRADIAGLGAPRPIAFHFGEQDVPAEWNNSASYNETVGPALDELRTIYRAFGADEEAIALIVTRDTGHVMDNRAMLEFLGD